MNAENRWGGRRGVSFRPPASWDIIGGGEFVCVALEPQRTDGGFRANLVLTVVDNAALTFRDWQAGTDRLLPILLEDYEVIDLQRLTVAGHPGGRRSATHRDACGRPLLMNQWFASVQSQGVTLTATADAASFGLLNSTFVAASRSLRISSVPASQDPGPSSPA